MMLATFAALGVMFFLLERLMPARDQPIVRRGFWVDAAYVPVHFFLRVSVNQVAALGLAVLGRRFLPGAAIGTLASHAVWVQALVLLLVLDLMFYVMHRLKHRWTWWWRLHETHHSSVDPDWMSGARFHPAEKLLDRLLFLLPLVVMGPSDRAVLIWAAVDAGFGMFVHSNLNCWVGRWKYVFNCPEMHLWHHACDPVRRECNFGNNFSIFDWLCGTAYVTTERPRVFGVEDPSYPVGNIFKQFFYAFRPWAAVRGGPPRPAGFVTSE